MIELTRDDLVLWLENPFTKALNQLLVNALELSKQQAINESYKNYQKTCFSERSKDELFCYAYIDVISNILNDTFIPLNEAVKSSDNDEINQFTSDFIKRTEEVLKNAGK